MVVIKLFLLVLLVDQGLAWWPFMGGEKVTAPLTKVKPDEGSEKSGGFLRNSPVPFEMSVAEQKFLAEAQRYMGDMSALDQCHQVIITRLRKSCHELGEEEIGKLAVDLFNCQSKAEGRTLYYCSEEMSLRDCTSEMDPDAWNAYHIISNRARSVCYATRNQQFRMKTEYLVNKLSHTAGDQMEFLENLKKGQDDLKDATKGTLARLTTGHRNLIQEQSRIRNDFSVVNKQLTNKMNDNMMALNHEKRIIQEAERQLNSMTEAIASTLATTTEELKNQDVKRVEEHKAVVSDLEDIKTKSMDTWEKIDEKTTSIREHQDESLTHHLDIINNLQKLNDTVMFMLKSIEDLESRFDIRLSWLATQFGGTGDKLRTLTICFFHFIYFIVMVISVLFLNAPPVSRVAVLIMVPFNTWAAIKLETGMSFVTMTMLILAIVAGNHVVEVAQLNLLKAEEKKNENRLRGPPMNYVENLGLPEPIRPGTPVHTQDKFSFHNSYQASPIHSSTMVSDTNHSSSPKPGSSPRHTPSVTFDPINVDLVDQAKRQLELDATDQSTMGSSTLTSTPSKRALNSKRCGAQTRLGSSCKRRISKIGIACEKHRK